MAKFVKGVTKKNPQASADRVQRLARDATAGKAQPTAPATVPEIESDRLLDWRLDDLPDDLHPHKNPTAIERIAPLMTMEKIGEDSFDSEGNRITSAALLPKALPQTPEGLDAWQALADVYTPKNIEKHNSVEHCRNLIMEADAAVRRAERVAKRGSVLARLKGTTA